MNGHFAAVSNIQEFIDKRDLDEYPYQYIFGYKNWSLNKFVWEKKEDILKIK